MCELRAARTLAVCPDIRSGCLQTIIHLDVTSFVSSMPADSRPIPAVFGIRPLATRTSLPENWLSPKARVDVKGHSSPRTTMHTDDLGWSQDVDSLSGKHAHDRAGYICLGLIDKY